MKISLNFVYGERSIFAWYCIRKCSCTYILSKVLSLLNSAPGKQIVYIFLPVRKN